MIQKYKPLWTSLVVGLVIAGGAFGANVTLPFVFQANSPARASEVNANFNAVKTAVDDNQTQIGALTGRIAALETPRSWTNLTYAAGWVDYNANSYPPVQYLVDGMGFVHLRGLTKRVSGSSQIIGTLPAGVRPVRTEVFWVLGGGSAGAQVNIGPTGDITLFSGDPAVVQFSGVTFDTR
jgi:hypothetical protein